MGAVDRIHELLGSQADELLTYKARGIARQYLQLPGPDFVSRVLTASDRSVGVLRSFQAILGHGRLANTGYMSILPVDQGVEHSAGASFAPNPEYFDPARIIELAIEGGCNAVASTVGVLGMMARKYAHRIPFICKLNHNELLTYPNAYRQTMFGSVEQAFNMGAAAVGTTVYFGSEDSDRELQEVADAFARAHDLGMVCILWAYLRNSAFKTRQADYHLAGDLTGQANHLAATLQADIVKQKMAETNGGFKALEFGKRDPRMYDELMPGDHPIELARYQVVNCYMGRVPLINSGGASGKDDYADAARTAVINKRAGGSGLITGRKAFQRPMAEGVKLLNLIQDIYLDPAIDVA